MSKEIDVKTEIVDVKAKLAAAEADLQAAKTNGIESLILMYGGMVTELEKQLTALYDHLPKPLSSTSEDDQDWSGSMFYSQTLKNSFGMVAPYEQYGLYGTVIGGIYLLGRGFGRIYNISHALEHEVGSLERDWYRGLAKVTESDLKFASQLSNRMKTKSILFAFGLPLGFTAFIAFKNSLKKSKRRY